MSDHPCPACAADVQAADAIDRGACPECGTDLERLLELREQQQEGRR